MKCGIRAHDVNQKGIQNICSTCYTSGIEFLQLVPEKGVDDFYKNSFSEEYALELRHLLGDIKIAVLGSYINPSNPDDALLRADIDKFKEKIKYASILNPLVVGTETGIYIVGKTDSEEAYQRVLSTMREIIAEAEKYNVFVGIEGVHCFVINTPTKMKRLIDDLKSDNVKVIFDPVNYLNIHNYMEQDKMISESFDILSDRICVLHAKDFIVENNEFKMVLPGTGMLNYKLILDNIKKYGLDIPIITEEIDEKEAMLAFNNFKKYL